MIGRWHLIRGSSVMVLVHDGINTTGRMARWNRLVGMRDDIIYERDNKRGNKIDFLLAFA